MHDSTGVLERPPTVPRIVGRITGDRPGPSLIVMAALHGNEPAGLLASQRLLARLRSERTPLRGELTVLAGNLTAIRERPRFLQKDLNRQWTPDRVAALRTTIDAEQAGAEDREQLELLQALAEVVDAARGPVYFIDLHTSSAEGGPFLTVGDTLRNRNFALSFPLPLILGLEEEVDGSLLEYLNNFGFITMGVEAGQHDAETSIERHEAVLCLALVHAGLVENPDARQIVECRAHLERASRDIPKVVEVRYRHAVDGCNGFRMEPGFVNFQQVAKGQLLARDGTGAIRAAETARVLLPLYQGKGNDGFFLAREVGFFWLRVSVVLRRLWLRALLPFLPGVKRHPDSDEMLRIDTRIARFYPLEFFHLFGYRKFRRTATELLVSRRRYDLTPPKEISISWKA